MLHPMVPQPSTSNTAPQYQDIQNVCPENKLIGEGTYGRVLSVLDPRVQKKVALKSISKIFTTPVSCKRIYREIKMLASFKHENILALYDIIVPHSKSDYDTIHILTDLMETNLHNLSVMSHDMTIEHVQIFMYQLMRGLKYLHSAGIIHRDIKPGNLLVNGNCLLKICDFGMSRYYGKGKDNNMTVDVVTQFYRSPELLMGSGYDEKLDIWSAGCVFYELMCGKILFETDPQNSVAQLEKIIDVLGTPNDSDLDKLAASVGARNHIHRNHMNKPCLLLNYLDPNQHRLIRSLADEAAKNLLLCGLLVFNPEIRCSAEKALTHPYFEIPRQRFHSSLCDCCPRDPFVYSPPMYTPLTIKNPEPMAPPEDNLKWEKEISLYSVHEYRKKIYQFILDFKSPLRKMHYSHGQFTWAQN